jgi:hypothetical protein
MKKVLIIAYAFPPLQVIGSQRPYGLAKYFPDYGWDPVVLTANHAGTAPDGIKVIKADCIDIIRSIKSIIRHSSHASGHEAIISNISNTVQPSFPENTLTKLIKEVLRYPDKERGWCRPAISAASDYLAKNSVDVIISTSYPVTSHLIARKLKQKFRIPWVADFRDPWTQNTYSDKYPAIKYFERKLELKTLSDADAIVTVTEPWIDLFGKIHKGKKIYCVTNGYDIDDFHEEEEVQLSKKLTITYAGSLYKGKRDPSLLFEVLDGLIKDKKIKRDLIELQFYGAKEEWISEKIKKYNLESIVKLYSSIPRNEMIRRLKESQVLLLLIWNNRKEEGFCPAKIYEYFGSKRPVFAIGWPHSVVKNLLEITNAGRIAGDIEGVRDIFMGYYREFIEYGEVKCSINKNVDNYTYNVITRRYAEILEDCV